MFFRGSSTGPYAYYHNISPQINLAKYFHRAAAVIMGLQKPDLMDVKFTDNNSPIYS